MGAWRYIAQRAISGQFLHYEVPLNRDELSWALSGAGALRGTVTPDVGRLRAADGRLLLEEWGTFLYAESDGEIKWGGIVVSSEFRDEEWTVEAAGFTTYPNGMAWDDIINEVDTDAFKVTRQIWLRLQAKPDGDLGVAVILNGQPPRLGTADVESRSASYGLTERVALSDVDTARKEALEEMGWEQRKVGAIVYLYRPTKSIPYRIALGNTTNLTRDVLTGRGWLFTDDFLFLRAPDYGGTILDDFGDPTRGILLADGWSAQTVDGQAALVPPTTRTILDYDQDIAVGKGEPYRLLATNTPDCGQEIDNLAKQTPFDYTETHSWNGENIAHRVDLYYPRAGRQRTDLAFVQGSNIAEVVQPSIDGDEFANEVIGLGAGEGDLALRRTIAVRDGRLRRTAVYTDKAVDDTARMDALIRDELAWRSNLLTISEIVVRDHENAPIGSWALGDDILVDAELPWLGEVQIWCRVVGWSLIGEDTARIALVRSDTIAYGA